MIYTLLFKHGAVGRMKSEVEPTVGEYYAAFTSDINGKIIVVDGYVAEILGEEYE